MPSRHSSLQRIFEAAMTRSGTSTTRIHTALAHHHGYDDGDVKDRQKKTVLCMRRRETAQSAPARGGARGTGPGQR
jgi:hypothetical protein